MNIGMKEVYIYFFNVRESGAQMQGWLKIYNSVGTQPESTSTLRFLRAKGKQYGHMQGMGITAQTRLLSLATFMQSRNQNASAIFDFPLSKRAHRKL